jgi:hypothetical protein
MMLSFTAETVGSPRHDQLLFRVAEPDRALSAAVSESGRGAASAESVWDGIGAVDSGVADDAQSEVNDMSEGQIEHSGSVAFGHELYDVTVDEGFSAVGSSLSEQHFVEGGKF